jgi:hypothetical protein
MFIQCGAPLLNISLSSQSGLNGSLSITAPFVIDGSVELASALSISDSLNLPIPEGLNGELLIYALFAEVYRGSDNIPVSLSAMDEATVACNTVNALALDGAVSISTELAEAFEGSLTSLNTIGEYALRASTDIRIPFGLYDTSGSCEIRLPQTTAHIIKDELEVYADGIDITKLLRSAEIKLFGGNEPIRLKAVLKPLKNTPKSIDILINGEAYAFRIDTAEHSPEQCTLTGSMPSGYASVTAGIKRASALCADDTDIIFSAADFVTQGIEADGTDHGIAVMLAEMCGAKARQMKDGRSMVYDASSCAVYTPKHILSWAKTSPERFKGAVEVIYGKNGDDHITLEPSSRKAVKGISLKVYGKSGIPVRADGGKLKLINSGNRETVTEGIIFENGYGRLSKPCMKILSAGFTADGKKVYADASCITAGIRYETTYDLYTVSAESDSVTLCAYLDNRVVIMKGSGSITSISAENICDHATAYKLAKSKLAEASDKLTLVTTHSNILNTTGALKVKTPYGTGEAISASINISTAPLKITDKLEVQIWQR